MGQSRVPANFVNRCFTFRQDTVVYERDDAINTLAVIKINKI